MSRPGPGRSRGVRARAWGRLLPLLLWIVGAAVAAQAPALSITAPSPEDYVTGTTELVATVSGAVPSKVVFFADGVAVCTIESPPYRCSWNAGRTVRAHVVRVVATLPGGARIVQTVRTKDAGVAASVDVDAVPVTVTVTDGHGRFVRGLTEDRFRVFENDAPQTITAFLAERAPLEVIVAIDISGSMAPALARVVSAVRAFLTKLPGDYGVTVIAFNDNVFTLAQNARGIDDRVKGLAELAAWGSTRLYDALASGLDLLKEGRGRKAIVVFTDGEDMASRSTMAEVQAAVEAGDATIYPIGQGRGATQKDLRAVLEQLARVTGGRAFATEKPAELDEAFDAIVDELSNQYLLSYVPKNLTRDSSWRSIRVAVPDTDFRIRARQGYRAVPHR